jgi:hypothetical protein
MHSAPAFVRSAPTAPSTLVPSYRPAFRRNFPPHRPHSRHFAAPLFSYSYELLFPQPLCFDNHPHCPGIWASNSRIASVFLCALGVSVANPFLSYACSFFTASKKINSFAIKQIQPLFRKCRGVRVGIPIPSLDSRRESTKTPGAGDATTGHPGWGYLTAETARQATWTRRTHPIIIAARSRSQVHG